jgi:hypothetical protein
MDAVDRMMTGLGSQNALASATIRQVYRSHLELLVFDRYDELEAALGNGGLAPLPADPSRFNVTPRLDGSHPIGEKDLDNQVAYLAALPATIGCLLEVASHVKSGPIEVTSLVRHSEYQEELRTTNTNAITSVPMHTMGLAFDIAIVNTPLETVYEIRNVLRRMRDEGDILFIGERKQLVFHVVPHPSRLGYFTDVYTRALSAPPATPVAQAIALTVPPLVPMIPSVDAEVAAIRPTPEFAREWWAAVPLPGDLSVQVLAALPPEPRFWSFRTMVALLLLGGIMGAHVERVSRIHRARQRH